MVCYVPQRKNMCRAMEEMRAEAAAKAAKEAAAKAAKEAEKRMREAGISEEVIKYTLDGMLRTTA